VKKEELFLAFYIIAIAVAVFYVEYRI